MTKVIDYEKLVSGYWERLGTILRQFNAADDCEFLETWVPDDDDHRSIAGIVEAAKMGGLPGIVLCLGPDTVQKLNLDRLKTTLAFYGTISIETLESGGAGIRVEVAF